MSRVPEFHCSRVKPSGHYLISGSGRVFRALGAACGGAADSSAGGCVRVCVRDRMAAFSFYTHGGKHEVDQESDSRRIGSGAD